MEPDWIYGDGIKHLATHVYGSCPWPKKAIVWSPMTRIPECIMDMPKDGRYVLLSTRDRDGVFGPDIGNYLPACIVKWFTPLCMAQHPKIEVMPHGLSQGDREGEHIVRANQVPRSFKNWVLLCHGVPPPSMTHYTWRKQCQDELSGRPWVTTLIPGGDPRYYVDGDTYCREMRSHPFVASPLGMCPESMRTWEAIYCGSIPIVLRHPSQEHFTDMPIAFVDSWTEVTPEWCAYTQEEIRKKNPERAYLSYWKKRILDAFHSA